MRRTSRLLQGLVVLAFAVTLPESPGGEMEFQLGQQERIRFLVKALGSKNSKPPEEGPIVRFPKKYNTDAQAVVYLAMQQLLQEGSAAFDMLIEHFDDARYAYSIETPSSIRHATVGDACHLIVHRSLICYKTMLGWLWSGQPAYTPWDDSSLEEWWKKNRTRDLWELQVEAIDAEIKFQKTVDYDKIVPIRVVGRMLILPREKFDETRNQNIKVLENLRGAISLTRTAYRPPSVDEYMTQLPWPTVNFGR